MLGCLTGSINTITGPSQSSFCWLFLETKPGVESQTWAVGVREAAVYSSAALLQNQTAGRELTAVLPALPPLFPQKNDSPL